ncbi:MAG: nucleoside triphosphate pyrophosphohydrolase, partial [Geminicoccaceae bacterium]
MIPEHESPIERLLWVMARLRDPDGGCPWDLEQDFASIAPYTVEEAYEVADAIARGDLEHLRDELGDLLLQVVYHAQMAKEAGRFDFDEVAARIADKMIRRHPHVFGAGEIEDARAQSHAWEAAKARERADKAAEQGERHRLLDDVPLALPALARAAKLQRRAARVGFDWPQAAQVLDKIE